MNQAQITRLMTFAQHGQPKEYAASDLMRSDLEAVLLAAVASKSEPTVQEPDDAEDAARYRFAMRSADYAVCVWDWTEHDWFCLDEKQLDAAIAQGGGE